MNRITFFVFWFASFVIRHRCAQKVFEGFLAAVCPPRRRAAGARWPNKLLVAFLAAGVAGAATLSAGHAHDATLGDQGGRRVRAARSLASIPYAICLLLACCLVMVIIFLLFCHLSMLLMLLLVKHIDVLCCYTVTYTPLAYNTKARWIMFCLRIAMRATRHLGALLKLVLVRRMDVRCCYLVTYTHLAFDTKAKLIMQSPQLATRTTRQLQRVVLGAVEVAAILVDMATPNVALYQRRRTADGQDLELLSTMPLCSRRRLTNGLDLELRYRRVFPYTCRQMVLLKLMVSGVKGLAGCWAIGQTALVRVFLRTLVTHPRPVLLVQLILLRVMIGYALIWVYGLKRG